MSSTGGALVDDASGTPTGPAGPVLGPLTFYHVDVFASRALTGNGLAVVLLDGTLPGETMLGIAQEMRQFETIFLSGIVGDEAEARIFTPEEELDFAGHPVLGAAAVLHTRSGAGGDDRRWRIRLGGRRLPVTTTGGARGVVQAEMNQGPAVLAPPLPHRVALRFAAALGVPPDQLRADIPGQVVSTGLPYLLLPVTAEGLAQSRVTVPDLPAMLEEVGADFVYVLDVEAPEGRTWDNRGVTEDVATGSAAGPVAVYLVNHGLRSAAEPFEVHQGRFVGRPSRIHVRHAADGSVLVGGPVAPFSSGTITTAGR